MKIEIFKCDICHIETRLEGEGKFVPRHSFIYETSIEFQYSRAYVDVCLACAMHVTAAFREAIATRMEERPI